MMRLILAIFASLCIGFSAAQAGVEKYLLRAVMAGETEDVARILKNNPDIDLMVPNEFSYTALQWAAWHGHTKIVELLLNFNPKITPQLLTSETLDNRTPLHNAALEGNIEIVKLLLAFDPKIAADLLVSKDGVADTALHLASNRGRVEVIKLLLDFNPSLAKSLMFARDLDGKTPLHRAIRGSHTKVISTLLEYESSEEFTKIVDNNGDSALGSAIDLGQSSIVAAFVRNGVSLDEVTIRGNKTSALEFLSKKENYSGLVGHVKRNRLDLLQHILTGRIQSQAEMDWRNP